MRAIASRWIEHVRSSFWFLPLLMLAAAASLAVFLLKIDWQLDPGIEASMSWAYSGGPEGARSILSTIAGSMITAASVTFSLASVALSIASQQYGSRVLRNFMRDRITQVLLGTFVATFIYSVLVVRTIRGTDNTGGFVPAISITVAIGLSLASLVLLIYFIHHVSASIQASHIIRVIAENLEATIPKLYPAEAGEAQHEGVITEMMESKGCYCLGLERSGFLQTIDLDVLMRLAREQNVVIKLLVKPGDHILAGSPLAEIWGTSTLDHREEKVLRKAFFVDRERTSAQDIRYQFQQLTDVIVRALSPGINDPFTAMNGIDELAAALLLFSREARVRDHRQDPSGALRLIVPTASAGEILRDTVGHITIYASSDHFVMDSLRRVLACVKPHLWQAEDYAVLTRLQAELDSREGR